MIVVGKSEKISACLETARRIAQTDSTVLITGETGTGKEVLAHFIHANSRRADGPFVAVSCANFSEQFVEDDLFGHEPGAFTGAARKRQGKVPLADGGSLFLDEIGELSWEIQAKLLRFLETRRYTRMGSDKECDADVRLFAATNRKLEVECRKGSFRDDLFYRLNVFQITLPPLRDRFEDIPDLVRYFLEEMAKKRSTTYSINPDALEALVKYRWPGNIRELRNVIERATAISTHGTIDMTHLPSLDSGFDTSVSKKPYHTQIKEHQRAIILSALKECEGNKTEAARKLGLNRTYLIRLIHELGLSECVEG